MDTIGYDPLDDICEILESPETLKDLDNIIGHTLQYKQFLLEKTCEDRALENEGNESSGENQNIASDITTVYNSITELHNQYDNYISKSNTAQGSILSLTSYISKLDLLKNNLQTSIKFFDNLKDLCDEYTNCLRQLKSGQNSEDNFIDMVQSYRSMNKLSVEYFQKDYKSINEVNDILVKISHLKETVADKAKKYIDQLFNDEGDVGMAISQDQFKLGLCEILSESDAQKFETIHWIIDNKVLFEFKQVFQIDDETSSLENLSRRYIFFKKILNNFQTKYAEYFPANWDLLLEITKTFYRLTINDLKIILKRDLPRSTGSASTSTQIQSNTDINIFMESLQTTLEFEKYIKVKFSNRLNKNNDVKNITTCFEPYIYIWIDNQNPVLQKKIMQYMSEPKVSSSTDNEENNSIIPSSMDLFRSYRQILNQALELVSASDDVSKDKMILQLTKFFNKWLLEYLNKILRNLLLPENESGQGKDEIDKNSIIQYTLLLINTADYCSTTINDLAEKLNEYCPNSAATIDTQLQGCKDQYLSLINSGISVLIKKVMIPELQFVWIEFNNINWSTVYIEDYSRYMVSLEKILKNGSLLKIVNSFYRELYVWNFWDKVINYIMDTYIQSIVFLLKPQSFTIDKKLAPKFSFTQVVSIGEQLQLDIELLKKTFHVLQEQDFSVQSSSSSLKRANSKIEQSLSVLIDFCKLLTAPISTDMDDSSKAGDDTIDTLDSSADGAYNQIFKKMTNNCTNPAVWAFVLVLKGVPWDLNTWSNVWMQGLPEGNIADWFIFRTPTVQSTFVQFNNSMYNVPNSEQEWYRFIHQDLKIIEIKTRKPTAITPRPSPSTSPLPQSNFQQRIGSLFNR